jgi:hypothetical protein
MYNDAMKNYMMRLANGGMYSYQGSMNPMNPPQVLVDGTGSIVPPSNMLDGGMMGNAQVRRSGLRPSGMFAGDFMNSQFMAAQADYMQGGTHMYQGKTIDSNDNPGLAKLAEKAPEAVKNMGYNPNSVAQQGMSMEANMANQVNAQANAMSSPQVADTTQFILVDEGKNLYFDNVNGRYVTMTPVTASLNGNNMA